LSPVRAVAYEQALTRWGIAVTGPLLSLADVFTEGVLDVIGDVVLDIGFGSGEALIELAEARPNECVIGIDVHTPGIAAVLDAVEKRGLRNVRVVEGDVFDLVSRIPARSLAAIRVYFPDPWPKRRQRGRRLIRVEVVDRLVPLLRRGGVLHLATDVDDYAAQMGDVCGAVPELTGGVIDRPSWRPVTRYEQRAITEGRRPVDLVYTVI
jgi:tRNA (guanine-N7-)-methyltransferase